MQYFDASPLEVTPAAARRQAIARGRRVSLALLPGAGGLLPLPFGLLL